MNVCVLANVVIIIRIIIIYDIGLVEVASDSWSSRALGKGVTQDPRFSVFPLLL